MEQPIDILSLMMVWVPTLAVIILCINILRLIYDFSIKRILRQVFLSDMTEWSGYIHVFLVMSLEIVAIYMLSFFLPDNVGFWGMITVVSSYAIVMFFNPFDVLKNWIKHKISSHKETDEDIDNYMIRLGISKTKQEDSIIHPWMDDEED